MSSWPNNLFHFFVIDIIPVLSAVRGTCGLYRLRRLLVRWLSLPEALLHLPDTLLRLTHYPHHRQDIAVEEPEEEEKQQ